MPDYVLTNASGGFRGIVRDLVTRVSDSVSRWEVQSEITLFARAVLIAAAKREDELELSASDRAGCARLVNDLIPRRIGAAQIALAPLTRDDAADLREFLAVARDIATGRISTAGDADELSDAIGDALDNLHSYLLTHSFVVAKYLDDVIGDGSTRSSDDAREEDQWDRVAHEVAGTSAEDVQPSSAENNLALAA